QAAALGRFRDRPAPRRRRQAAEAQGPGTLLGRDRSQPVGRGAPRPGRILAYEIRWATTKNTTPRAASTSPAMACHCRRFDLKPRTPPTTLRAEKRIEIPPVKKEMTALSPPRTRAAVAHSSSSTSFAAAFPASAA